MPQHQREREREGGGRAGGGGGGGRPTGRQTGTVSETDIKLREHKTFI